MCTTDFGDNGVGILVDRLWELGGERGCLMGCTCGGALYHLFLSESSSMGYTDCYVITQQLESLCWHAASLQIVFFCKQVICQSWDNSVSLVGQFWFAMANLY